MSVVDSPWTTSCLRPYCKPRGNIVYPYLSWVYCSIWTSHTSNSMYIRPSNRIVIWTTVDPDRSDSWWQFQILLCASPLNIGYGLWPMWGTSGDGDHSAPFKLMKPSWTSRCHSWSYFTTRIHVQSCSFLEPMVATTRIPPRYNGKLQHSGYIHGEVFHLLHSTPS